MLLGFSLDDHSPIYMLVGNISLLDVQVKSPISIELPSCKSEILMILFFAIMFTFLLIVHVSVHLLVLTYNQTLMNQTKLPSLNLLLSPWNSESWKQNYVAIPQYCRWNSSTPDYIKATEASFLHCLRSAWIDFILLPLSSAWAPLMQ